MGAQDDEESEQFAGSAVALDKEVSSYLNEAPVSWLVECLEWWKANSSRFPHVALLARKVLCIPASETPSKRLFSATGKVITVKRASLSPTNVNAILF